MTAVPAAHRQPGFLQGLMLVLPITMAVMGVSVLTTVIPLMEEHFKSFPYSEYAVPILMTVPALWILGFSPVAGWLADRFGRRRMLIWAMLVYAVVGTLPTFLDSIYTIFISRCGVGLCESIVMTVTTTMICDYFKGHDREKWLASQTATASLAALVIIPLGGVFAALLGWRGPFYLYAFSLILVVGILLFTWEPEKPDSVQESPVADTDAIYHTIPWLRLLSLCALTLIAAISFYAIITQNGNALAALGIKNPASIGIYTDICSIGVPIGSFLYSRLGSRLHIGWLVLMDFLLIGVGFWFMGHATTPGFYTAWAFVNQVGCGMVLPTMLVWTTRGLAYRIRGFGNGLWQGSFAIGQFATSVLIPFLGDQLGGLPGAFKALGMIALITAVGALVGKQFWGHRAYRLLKFRGYMLCTIALGGLLLLAVGARSAPAGDRDPLADYYGNTAVCAGGLDADDACHIWIERDGTFVMFGGMQGGHFGHYKVGPRRPDGQVPVCFYLDTLGIDIPDELTAVHPGPPRPPPAGGAQPPEGDGSAGHPGASPVANGSTPTAVGPTSEEGGGLAPGGTGPMGCDTVNWRTTCGPGHGKPALDANGKPLSLARSIIARFHNGMCYPMGGRKLGDHWVETDDPSPSQGGNDQMFLIPGHR